MRYLSYIVYPLVVVYAIYALIYDTHKSYYSWIIGSSFLFFDSSCAFLFEKKTPKRFIEWSCIYVWVLANDSTIVHQLQTQICGPFALESVCVQSAQYLH